MRLPPVKKKEDNSPKTRQGFHLPENKQIYLAVVLFFTGCFLSVFFGFKTIIGLFDFVKILVASAVLAVAVQFLFLRSAFPMKQGEQTAFAILSAGPFLCGLFFLLNFSIPVKSETIEVNVIKAHERSGSVYFMADGLPCKDYPELCVKYMAGEKAFRSGDQLEVKIDKGIGGYEVLKRITVIRR